MEQNFINIVIFKTIVLQKGVLQYQATLYYWSTAGFICTTFAPPAVLVPVYPVSELLTPAVQQYRRLSYNWFYPPLHLPSRV